VRELTPKAFLFENVRGLARAAFSDYLRYIVERLRRPAMTARPGENWQKHLTRLSGLATDEVDGPLYRVEIHKINAADYGAAQKRHRVIVVGIRADLDSDWQFPTPTHSSDALVWEQCVTGEYWRRHRVPTKSRPALTKVDRRMAARLDDLFAAPDRLPWVTVRDVIHDLPDPEKLRESLYSNHRFQPGARSYAGHTGVLWTHPLKL